MYTIKPTCENFISKDGSVFEISPTTWSNYVHAGRIIRNWNTQSEKRFMHETFLRLKNCWILFSKTTFLLKGIVSQNVTDYQQLQCFFSIMFLRALIFGVITQRYSFPLRICLETRGWKWMYSSEHTQKYISNPQLFAIMQPFYFPSTHINITNMRLDVGTNSQVPL